MDRIDFREIWPQLIGLVPVYGGDNGNGTEILLANRESLYSPVRTKTLLRRLARAFTIDLQAARERYSEVCGRSYALPIPLRPGLVLVPVHARYARFKDDGTRAYLVKAKIASFSRLPAGAKSAKGVSGKEYAQMRTRLTFTDGSHLDVPHDPDGVRSLLLLAEKIEREAQLPGAGVFPCMGLSISERRQPSVSERRPFGCIYRIFSPPSDDPE